MRVRVYDTESNSYFKSEVYAVINSGYYEKFLVLTPLYMGNNFSFYDYLDKRNNQLNVLVNSIFQERPTDWIYKKSKSVDEQIEEYKNILSDDIRFFEYSGFYWLFDDIDTMSSLLKGNSINLKDSIFENKLYNDINSENWNYVETQSDIEFLMSETCGFHDSIINEVSYISGGYVNSKKEMFSSSSRQISVKIDSQISDNLEMVFDGVIAMNIRPPKDNYFGDIFGASLFIENATIFFYDEEIENIQSDYHGNMVSAYGLKWRFRNDKK